MVIGRRVSRRKGQQLVALPPELRERLGIIPGQWVYFHLGRKNEVVLSTSPARAGGKPPTASLEAEVAELRARLAQREKQLAETAPAARRQAWLDLAMGKLAVELRGVPVLGAINDRLRRIEAELGIRRGPWRYRAKRARPASAAGSGSDPVPSPSSSPDVALSEGEALAPGPSVPGQPIEA